MSILTCTNVHPSNEVITIDKTYHTDEEITELKKEHPEWAYLPNDSAVFHRNQPRFSMTINFSGGTGCLLWWVNTFTNVKTGKRFSLHQGKFTTYVKGSEYHNGDNITYTNGVLADKLNNGQDWQFQTTLYQVDSTQLSSTGNPIPLYDMKFCQGKLSIDGGNIKISSGISNLLKALYLYIPKDSSGNINFANCGFGYYGQTINLSDGSTFTIDGGSSCMLVGGAVIEVNGKRYLINAYDAKTGILTIKDRLDSSIQTGDKFVIYTSYFIDKPHYFMTRSVPTITPEVKRISSLKKNYGRNTGYSDGKTNGYTVMYTSTENDCSIKIVGTNDVKLTDELVNNITGNIKQNFNITGLHCFCDYKQSSANQDDYSPLKYYQFSVYEGKYNSDNKIIRGDLIAQSEDIYNDDVSYDFYIPFVNQPLSINYRIVTQENAVYEGNYTKEFKASTDDNGNQLQAPITDFSSELSDDKSHAILYWKWSDDIQGKFVVYRRNKQDGNFSWNIIYASSYIEKDKGVEVKINDYTAGFNIDYDYLIQYIYMSDDTINRTNNIVTVTNTVKYYKPFVVSDITYNCDETIITSLIPMSTGMVWKKYSYTAQETWKFVCPPDSNDITQNIGINLYDTTNGMPLITRNNKEYESSSFSMNLLQLTCPNQEIRDDINLVRKWIKFINGENDFLLKSVKGDVWVMEIAGNPSRAYEYGTNELLTTVKYDWVQVAKTEDVFVRNK